MLCLQLALGRLLARQEAAVPDVEQALPEAEQGEGNGGDGVGAALEEEAEAGKSGSAQIHVAPAQQQVAGRGPQQMLLM